MKTYNCGGGLIYEIPQADIEYVGYFYGLKGNEDIRNAYARLTKLRGRAPDFLMNAELFEFDTRAAASDVVSGGKVHRLTQSYGIAFPDNKTAVFSYNNNVKAKDYVGAYPTIVRNGKKEVSIPKGIGGVRGRTALGVSKTNDKLYVSLIPDKAGVSLGTLSNNMLTVGASNAINLDGGGSTQFYAPLGKHFTGRKVRGFIAIWLKNPMDVRTVKVRTSLLIRSGPSILHSRIGKLYNGDTVNVLEVKYGYARITSGGWVSTKYLKK